MGQARQAQKIANAVTNPQSTVTGHEKHRGTKVCRVSVFLDQSIQEVVAGLRSKH